MNFISKKKNIRTFNIQQRLNLRKRKLKEEYVTYVYRKTNLTMKVLSSEKKLPYTQEIEITKSREKNDEKYDDHVDDQRRI